MPQMLEAASASDVVARDTPTTEAVDTASRVAKKAAEAPALHCSAGVLAREWLADSLHRGEMSTEDAVRLMRAIDEGEVREVEMQKPLASRCQKYAQRIWQLLTLRWSKSQASEIQ